MKRKVKHFFIIPLKLSIGLFVEASPAGVRYIDQLEKGPSNHCFEKYLMKLSISKVCHFFKKID